MGNYILELQVLEDRELVQEKLRLQLHLAS